MAGRLVDVEGAEVGLHLHTRQQLAVGLHDPRDAERLALALLAVALKSLGRDAALARDLDPALELALRVLGGAPRVVEVRVHPELAAARVDDRSREPVVVGVRVRAHEQPHVLDPEAGLVEGALELLHRSRVADAGVHQHDAAPRGDRPGVAVGHPGPGQRQAQPPHARQHAIGAPELTLSPLRGHAGRIWRVLAELAEGDVAAHEGLTPARYLERVAARRAHDQAAAERGPATDAAA